MISALVDEVEPIYKYALHTLRMGTVAESGLK